VLLHYTLWDYETDLMEVIISADEWALTLPLVLIE
jgi:hypothetical protein